MKRDRPRRGQGINMQRRKRGKIKDGEEKTKVTGETRTSKNERKVGTEESRLGLLLEGLADRRPLAQLLCFCSCQTHLALERIVRRARECKKDQKTAYLVASSTRLVLHPTPSSPSLLADRHRASHGSQSGKLGGRSLEHWRCFGSKDPWDVSNTDTKSVLRL